MPAIRDDVRGVGASITVERRRLGDRVARAAAVTHQFAALAFYTAGTAQVEQRVRWRLAAGDVLVVPAGEPHRALRAERVEFWGLGFCVPCVPRQGAAQLLAPFERVRAGGSAVVHVPRSRRPYLARLFKELQHEIARPARASRDVRYSLLALIVHEVEQATAATVDPLPAAGLVAATLRLIEQRCLGPLSLMDLAEAVGRSPAHLTTTLRRATGRTAGAWITAFRMAQARHLLLHADLAVEDVAGRIGYADATHFIRTFRRDHGATPAAWRDAARRSRDA